MWTTAKKTNARHARCVATRHLLVEFENASSHFKFSWSVEVCEDMTSFRSCFRSQNPCRPKCYAVLHRPLPSLMDYDHFANMNADLIFQARNTYTQTDALHVFLMLDVLLDVRKKCPCVWTNAVSVCNNTGHDSFAAIEFVGTHKRHLESASFLAVHTRR